MRKANGTPISGASSSTYVLTAAELDKTISVTVTGSKTDYVDASATSLGVGPVINDNSLDDDGNPTGFTDEPLAFRWAALDPTQLMRAVILLNTAQGWEDFREAASYFAAPAQNIVASNVPDQRNIIRTQRPIFDYRAKQTVW